MLSGRVEPRRLLHRMLAAFFIFNGPVNAAVTGWTAATLPPDWPAYHRWWESGQALMAALSMVALVVLARATLRDRQTATHTRARQNEHPSGLAPRAPPD